MASVREIYHWLDGMAPFSTQQGFDNAGLLVGREGAPVTRILVALDVTPEVIAQAKAQGAQLIVSHHPVIWGTLSSVTDGDLTGQRLLALIEAGVAVISAHTNLDAAEGGVNTQLAACLGLEDCVPIVQEGMDDAGRPYGIGRVGLRAGGAVCLSAFAEEVKEKLSIPGLRLLDAGRPAHRIAVGGGACGDMIAQVSAHGCDTFVTADLKHAHYLEARALGLNLIDAGHYATEAVVCPPLAQKLGAAFPEVTVTLASCEGEVFLCL